MNKIIFASVLAVATALVGSPSPAAAGHNHYDDDDDKVIAAVGGFVGGLIVGSTIHSSPRVPAPAVVVSASYGQGNGHYRHGRWEWTTVRVWVPGHWTYVGRECERPRKVWVAGHYDHRRERVWVAHRPGQGCDHGCR